MIKFLIIFLLILQTSTLSSAPPKIRQERLIDLDIIPREKQEEIDYTKIIAPTVIGTVIVSCIYAAIFEDNNNDDNIKKQKGISHD